MQLSIETLLQAPPIPTILLQQKNNPTLQKNFFLTRPIQAVNNKTSLLKTGCLSTKTPIKSI